jgi:hypothetical protein
MLLHFLAVLKKQREMIAFMAFALLSGKCVLKWLFPALYKVSNNLFMKHLNNVYLSKAPNTQCNKLRRTLQKRYEYRRHYKNYTSISFIYTKFSCM